jgi:hypothetical protein
MAKVCAPRVYRDGSKFRTAEPVHDGGSSVVVSGIPRKAIVFMTDSAAPVLTGNETLTYDGSKFMNLKGNFIVDNSFLIYDDIGRTYQKSFEFKTNGHFNIVDGLDPSGAYTIVVELDIDVDNNLTGNSLEEPVVLGDIIGGGKNLFILKYKQIFNTNNYVQGIVESNYHGAFLNVDGSFVEINETIFDTSGDVVAPIFVYEDGHIKATYTICTALEGVEYINAYYDIEIMGSRRFVVRDWSFSLLLN